ncbi:hypothetical protein CC80DRAFT_528618 [Byssothecium circinans]|uniref:Uncharacterized protein n=1 Tax=Byssothecium circinans TaxID=147558 RepID=A0A6A5TEQ7_9PLEO|nr:hypothetical protein CC80DRAFT_528618 [Byssothecium circinans]
MAPTPFRLGLLPRRFQFLLAIALLFLITIFTLGPPSPASVPTVEQVKDAVKNPHLPKVSVPDVSLPSVADVLNSVGQPAHKKPPPKQANSTAASSYRAIEWLSDFKWRNPFSSGVTMDENRALLPPLKIRPSIYTYYDPKPKQDKHVKEAEHRLVLAWRRAWWAQGFRPQVLSRREAMNHPQYQLVQRLKLAPSVETEIMRWLAWGALDGGVLTNWLALPMANHDNRMLAFLRRGEYPALSRVNTLHNGVFFGEGAAVNDAIKKAVNNKLFQDATANSDKIAKLAKQEGGLVVNLLDQEDIAIDNKASGIAYYSSYALSNNYAGKYRSVSEKMTSTTSVEGLELLASLINSHLHLTFQENYPEGLAVVKPLPEHTTALTDEAIDIARNLTQCPASPMPKSCPPNRLTCKPCDPTKTQRVKLIETLQNSTKQYTVGTVPHPYTLTSLHYTRDTIDPQFTRKNPRDIWINEVTKDIFVDHSEKYRVVNFKELVAAPESPHHSLWLTAERVTQADLDWIFGFSLPKTSYSKVKPLHSHLADVTLFPRPGMPPPLSTVEVPEERWIIKEEERLKKARETLKSKDPHVVSIVQAVEAWNAVDTEAWKFTRAFSARRRMERMKWEEEEGKFAGSEKNAGVRPVSTGGRWHDRS